MQLSGKLIFAEFL